MNNENPMLTFVKAMSDPDRLRIIGLLAQHEAKRAEITTQLELPMREVFNHLAFLEHIGVVHEVDGVYKLESDHLEKLARSQLAAGRQTYVPASELDEKTRKVLKIYLNPDGSIRQIPSSVVKPEHFHIILEYLARAFESGVNYTEREVNTIIKRFHADFAGLRRDLIDSRLLARKSDGSKYWRVS
jgi:hypothetical protein